MPSARPPEPLPPLTGQRLEVTTAHPDGTTNDPQRRSHTLALTHTPHTHTQKKTRTDGTDHTITTTANHIMGGDKAPA